MKAVFFVTKNLLENKDIKKYRSGSNKQSVFGIFKGSNMSINETEKPDEESSGQ